MSTCFFVSDLHGNVDRYKKLFKSIRKEKPDAVFLGGDLLPSRLFALSSIYSLPGNFIKDFLAANLMQLKSKLGNAYPRIFLILGNEDGSSAEQDLIDVESMGLWEYVSDRKVHFEQYLIFGYSYVPPTPFLLKDWERYDVSRYSDPGCVPPEEGWHSTVVDKNIISFSTIQEDLNHLLYNIDLSRTILLFHTPPYQTNLDRAQLDGLMIDHVPLDVHVGSIAIKKLIELRKPLITLHGHVHESARLTGSWKEKIGTTFAFSAAHDGPELALVRFDPEVPQTATRELI